ncbi:MAG: glycogen/starch synthase, partial [Pseudobutyrivibrio sp.]|nr:glycogen/starch synthase [Pseudobutyrivibrio sp.]
MNKILFASSECVPFVKTGGLADVCGALPKEFSKEYFDVRVVLPYYTFIPEKYKKDFKYLTSFQMNMGPLVGTKYVGVFEYELDGVTFYFIDNHDYFDC